MSRESKGTGSIVPLAKKWMVKIPIGKYPNGTTRYKTQVCVTRTEARKVRLLLLVERDAGKLMVGQEQRLEKFATFLLFHQQRVTERTADGYLRDLQKHVFPRFGQRYMSDIKPIEFEQLFNDLVTTLRTNTVNHVRTALSNVYSEAERLEIVPNNPIHRTRKMRAQQGEKPCRYPPLSPEEAREFIRAASGSWLQDYLKLAIGLGMRQGEILGLQWSDIDFREGILHVQRTISWDSIRQPDGISTYGLFVKPPKTRNSRRDLNLSSELLAMFEERFSQHLSNYCAPTEYIFHCSSGTPYSASSVRKQFKKMILDHGLRYVRMHDLRHTFATILLDQDGGNLSGVSRAMGHSSISVTLDVYGHSAGVADQATAKMDEILFGAYSKNSEAS